MKNLSFKSLIVTCKILETLLQLSIWFLATCFFKKFRGISQNYHYEISQNEFLRNFTKCFLQSFAKYFSEIPPNFAKLLYEISQNPLYDILLNILAKFREILRN
jgi:hypothetical protein